MGDSGWMSLCVFMGVKVSTFRVEFSVVKSFVYPLEPGLIPSLAPGFHWKPKR